ncbi:MAG TPA: WD40 repeat domain-containing protein [Ktedonobacteraceae bacterium]|nr:WD40 repeat domain-containing protein [Ktedonobacteraceae bacterium]
MLEDAAGTADTSPLTYRGHSDYIFALTFSPDGAHVASASRDATVRVWHINQHVHNMDTEDITVYHEHGRDASSVLSVAWSPDGKYIASGDTTGIIQVWEAYPGKTMLTYHGHTRFVRGIAWSPDGQHIVSGGDFGDSTAQVWEALTGRHIYTHIRQYRIFAVSWEPRGRHIATCSFDGSVQLWDAYTGDVKLVYTGHSGPVYTSAWSPDAKLIASGGKDSTLQVWEAATGKTVSTYRGHTKAVKTLAWSPDSKYIVSGGDDMNVEVWEAMTGERITFNQDHEKWVRAVAWSPDGSYIAATSSHTVQVTPRSSLFSVR